MIAARRGILVALVVVGTLAAAIPGVREELSWLWASAVGTAEGYEDHLASWPDGRHVAQAAHRADEAHWRKAQAEGSIAVLEGYLSRHPNGSGAQAARQRVEELRWQATKTAQSVQATQAYLQAYPGGRFAAEAASEVESLRWRDAQKADTIRAYAQYLAAHAAGPHAPEARSRRAALANDESLFARAREQGSEEALTAFLEAHPGHAREAQARAALRDLAGRDLVDLVNEQKVEVQANGSGIESVSVRVRRRVPHAIAIRIPVGTYFVSHNAGAQNMVGTEERTARLASDEWVSVQVPAACANRPKDIPGDDDRFTVARAPNRQELVKLMPVLAAANASFAVRQAAVWIVTDDADYSDLGTLVTSTLGGFGGSRTIGPDDAVRAMRICESAGIAIRAKAIWGDRQELLREVRDEALRQWLAGRP